MNEALLEPKENQDDDFDFFAMSNIEDMEYDAVFSCGNWIESDDCGDHDCWH